MKTFETYDEMLAEMQDGQSPCGTYVNETPVYFLMPADATDKQTRDAAFEVRNGRRMSGYEHTMLSAAEAMHEREAALA